MAYADVSLASTSVTNPVFGAATNFYFDSWVSGSAGSNDQSARNSDSATAALGNALSSTGNAQGQSSGSTPAAPFSIPPIAYYAAGGAFLLLLATIYFTRK